MEALIGCLGKMLDSQWCQHLVLKFFYFTVDILLVHMVSGGINSLSFVYSVVQQQRVVIPNKHGEKLVGLLHETGSSEIVILCHGFRSSKVQ